MRKIYNLSMDEDFQNQLGILSTILEFGIPIFQFSQWKMVALILHENALIQNAQVKSKSLFTLPSLSISSKCKATVWFP